MHRSKNIKTGPINESVSKHPTYLMSGEFRDSIVPNQSQSE